MNEPHLNEKNPSTFSHADFLKATDELGMEAGNLSRRGEPVGNESLDLLGSARQELADSELIDPNEQHFHQLVDALREMAEEVELPEQIPEEIDLGILETACAAAIAKVGQISVGEVERFCRQELEDFSRLLTDTQSKEILGPILSCLAKAAIKGDAEQVNLVLPDAFMGENKLNFLGISWQRGVLKIVGDVGDYVATSASGGQVIVKGNADGWAGDAMNGNAQLKIEGNAGFSAGMSAGDEAEIIIEGDVGEMCGRFMMGRAKITVKGNASVGLGHGAMGHCQIVVEGNAGENVGLSAGGSASITVKGQIESLGRTMDKILINAGSLKNQVIRKASVEPFAATIIVGGQEIEPDFQRPDDYL